MFLVPDRKKFNFEWTNYWWLSLNVRLKWLSSFELFQAWCLNNSKQIFYCQSELSGWNQILHAGAGGSYLGDIHFHFFPVWSDFSFFPFLAFTSSTENTQLWRPFTCTLSHSHIQSLRAHALSLLLSFSLTHTLSLTLYRTQHTRKLALTLDCFS